MYWVLSAAEQTTAGLQRPSCYVAHNSVDEHLEPGSAGGAFRLEPDSAGPGQAHSHVGATTGMAKTPLHAASCPLRLASACSVLEVISSPR